MEGGRNWGAGPGGRRAPIVRHVCLDEMAGGQGTIETEFAGQGGGGDDACELAGVGARAGWVWAFDAEEVEHGHLRFQDGAAANGADFDARHGDADLEIAV
jgi:hypothetical protein